MKIRAYQEGDRARVISLWQTVFPDDPPHNEPNRVIDSKLRVDDMLFVAIEGVGLLGTAMAGWDGHRGWLYHVAVDPAHQRRGIGRALVAHATSILAERGCAKVNLQVRTRNHEVIAFYEAVGFRVEEIVSLGRRLDAPHE